MATHSSTLAWKIPWMEEPGGLQSMGSLRVGHSWATSLSLFTFMHWRRKWQPTPVFLPGESQGRWRLGGLPPVGLHRVGHDWSDLAAEAAAGASQVALVVKNPPANAGDRRDTGSVPGSGRSPGGGHGNPLQYSCLENSITREAWQLYSVGSHRVGHSWNDLSLHAGSWKYWWGGGDRLGDFRCS